MNKFFTIMVIPERTSQVRKFIVPGWMVRAGTLLVVFLALLGGIMLANYIYVMGQIDENKTLKSENRKLKQQVQIFRNKLDTIESTLDRVKTFSTRLKVITNIEDRGDLIQSLNQKLPDAATNVGSSDSARETEQKDVAGNESVHSENEDPYERRQFEIMEQHFTDVTYSSLILEQTLQDQYELLSDQRAFLSALPTRKPAVGYFTSGFGIRKAPFGGREKMHEGLDIANYPGTPIRVTADGVVSFADTRAGYGRTVIVDHGYGIETWYAHNSRIITKKGQKVKRGEQISLLGNTGRSTGPHLHYEVRVNGTPVDPLSYILEN